MTIETANIIIGHEDRPSDIEQIAHLVTATKFFSPAEVEIAVELIRERFAKGAASGYEFVFARGDSALAGYACFGEIPCTVGSYDLYWIVVDPLFQRSGIGRRLMEEVECRISQLGGRGIYIDTSGRQQYLSTHRFYERCGYARIADLPDFYAPGDPKVVYWRSIP